MKHLFLCLGSYPLPDLKGFPDSESIPCSCRLPDVPSLSAVPFLPHPAHMDLGETILQPPFLK